MQNLRVSLVQTYLHWENKEANRESLHERLHGLAGQTDLVILPEMFTTGFSMQPEKLAEPIPGPTFEWMQQLSAKIGAVITGSFIARENNHYYNRLLWMRPDGTWEHYDKRHLFTLAGEQHHYSPGTKRLIVELMGWKILPLVCYDLRFPVWSRNNDDYDLLLYVANFPAKRSMAWKSLLQARAIENQAYTIGLNRIGTDGNDIYYSGDSTLLDAGGRILYQVAHEEACHTLVLDHQKLEEYRRRYSFLPDRDTFHLEP